MAGWSVEIVENDDEIRVDFVVGGQRFRIAQVELDEPDAIDTTTDIVEAREHCRYTKERFVHALSVLGVTVDAEQSNVWTRLDVLAGQVLAIGEHIDARHKTELQALQRVAELARALPDECDNCRSKPGAITLCSMCLSARRLREALAEVKKGDT